MTTSPISHMMFLTTPYAAFILMLHFGVAHIALEVRQQKMYPVPISAHATRAFTNIASSSYLSEVWNLRTYRQKILTNGLGCTKRFGVGREGANVVVDSSNRLRLCTAHGSSTPLRPSLIRPLRPSDYMSTLFCYVFVALFAFH